jgi:hypothetical protein
VPLLASAYCIIFGSKFHELNCQEAVIGTSTLVSLASHKYVDRVQPKIRKGEQKIASRNSVRKATLVSYLFLRTLVAPCQKHYSYSLRQAGLAEAHESMEEP